jgi:hypothetical protein
MVGTSSGRLLVGGAAWMLLLLAPANSGANGYPDVTEYASDGFGTDLSLYGLFNVAYHGFGVGAGTQFAYPILPTGIFDHPRHRDALHVLVGLDFYHWSWDSQGSGIRLMVFAPHAGARYAVYLTDRLGFFAALMLGVGIAEAEGISPDPAFFWSGAAGAVWDLSDLLSLRCEFGWGRYSDVFRLGVLLRL